MNETELPPPPACSQCGGPHLHGIEHRHRTTCPRYAADLATIEADHRRGRGIRPATTTEMEILDEHKYEPLDDDEHYGIAFDHDGIHHRRPLILDSRGRHRPAERYPDTGGD